MARSIKAIALVAALALAAFTAAAGAEELVVNGDFECPVVGTSQGWDIYESNYMDEGCGGLGWTVEWADDYDDAPETAYLELHRTVNGWAHYEGEQHAELDTDWQGPGGSSGEEASVRIYQEVSSCEGAGYTLTYAWSPRPNHDDNVLEVYFDGELIATHEGEGGSQTDWTLETFQVAESDEDEDSSAVLMFVETGEPDSLGMFLDAVSVEGIACDTDLIAGGGSPASAEDAGQVTAEWDEESCTWTVTYTTDEPWFLLETHLDVQCDPDDFPQTGSGNPKVGHFYYQDEFDFEDEVREWEYTGIEADCACPYFAAHSVVVDDTVEDVQVVSGEVPVTVTRRRTPDDPFSDTDSPAELAWVHPSWNSQITSGEGGEDGQHLLDLGAQWIWETYRPCSPDHADNTTCNESIFGSVITMETSFEVEGLVVGGVLSITCDNGYEAFLNGHSVGSAQVAGEWRTSDLTQSYVDTAGWQSVESYDVSDLLQEGDNTLVIDAANENFEQGVDGHGSDGSNSLNPAGCIFAVEVDRAREETAWGDGRDFPGNNWATYFQCEACAAPPTKMAANRFRSFGNTGGEEVYLGVGDLGVAENRNASEYSWQKPGSYDIEFEYVKRGKRSKLVSRWGPAGEDLDNTLEYELDGMLGEMNSFEIILADRDVCEDPCQVDFTNVYLDGEFLGNFYGSDDFASYPFASGELDDGFLFTGTIHLEGVFSNSQERSKVEIVTGQGFAD